jgi:NADPH2:quinone reductase
MRRIVINAYGGPEQLAIATFDEQLKPGRAQILVAVEAAGVNYIDVYQRKGGGSHPAALPFTPGLEGVGRVRAVGEGVEDPPRVGQRVAWMDAPGSYAEQLLLPAQRAIPIPDTLTGAQALLFQGLTAQYLATEYRNVQPGDRVLVHAAAGGVGHLLVQWLKHLGAWVVGTVSSEEKGLRIAGGSVFAYTAEPHELLRRSAEVVNGYTAGWLKVGDSTSYELDRASEAHQAIEGRHTKGKLYLTP